MGFLFVCLAILKQSLCGPDCPRTCNVDQVGLRYPPTSASRAQGLKAHLNHIRFKHKSRCGGASLSPWGTSRLKDQESKASRRPHGSQEQIKLLELQCPHLRKWSFYIITSLDSDKDKITSGQALRAKGLAHKVQGEKTNVVLCPRVGAGYLVYFLSTHTNK